MTNLEKFRDSRSTSAHDAFQRWRERNPDGFFLNLRTSAQAMLHCTHCGHFEDPARELSGDWNLTAKKKVCAMTIAVLTEWAGEHEIELVVCRDCRPV